MDVFIERQQISLGLSHIDRLISAVKLRAVDLSAIQFLSNFGVLLNNQDVLLLTTFNGIPSS